MAGGTDDREPPDGGRQQELRVFVGIGGNLGDRLATLRSAVAMIDGDEVPRTRVVAASGVYETSPVGPSEGAFLNAVIELRTRLGLHELLARLLAVEARHGRERRRKWDARTLDLDVLVASRRVGEGWEAIEVEREGLRVPHPQLGTRDFVLVPLRELAGADLRVHGRTVAQWLGGLDGQPSTILRRLGEGLLEGDGGGGEGARA